MTLPLPWDFRAEKNTDPDRLQDVIDRIALQFPVTAANMVGAVQGTTLPTSPVNGQDYYYVADATNGVVWHLKYRSASASSYKWEFVGGPPLRAYVATAEGTASLTYVALATAGPSVTVPLAGDYDVSIGSVSTNTGANTNLHGFDVGATGAADAESCRGNQQQTSGSFVVRKTALAASTALVSKYRTTGGTGTWEKRWMEVLPVRVG